MNQKAAQRDMPDPAIIERVKESGINEAMAQYVPERGTTLVRNKKDAKRVIKILRTLKDRIHAWDTETIGFDVKVDSPVGNGQVLCAQCFCGPDVDFGNGPRLFIDNYADASGVLDEFR